MSNYGKRMVRESEIKKIGQGSGGGSTTKTYGIKLVELCQQLGRQVDLRIVTKQDLINAGLPILDTNVAKQSSYPYRNLVIDVPVGESNEIILEGIFGVARGDDVALFSTGNSWYGNEPALYAWRNGGEDWMLKNTRWSANKTVGNYVPIYVVYDFTDVATYFEFLNENVGLYYYDTDLQDYVSVGSGTYDPDTTYYTKALENYYQAPMTPEAYFNYSKTHVEPTGYIYIKNGDSYEIIEYEAEYDPTQTYYVAEHTSDPIYMVSATNEGTLGVSSKAQNQLINVFEPNIMVTNPVVNIRYGTQFTVPAAQGTYTLKVTVDSEGHPTFSWVTDATE